jgi:hypothetical protein
MSAPRKTEACGACLYIRVGRQGWYECHRKEPQISIKKECDDEAINPIALWPSISTSDWCGQYAPKKKGA